MCCPYRRFWIAPRWVPSPRLPVERQQTYLQEMFDASSKDPSANARISYVVAWPITAPPEFVDMIKQRRPEAMVILAYWAVLLHIVA